MEYPDLNPNKIQIRLLNLKPSPQKDDIIICDLTRVDLDCEIGIYEALSYVWGDQKHQVKIQLGGHSMEITENLYLALQSLRSTEKTRTLWIDALCINQQQSKEREHQVSLMNIIYKKARSVVIWLGESLENCNLAMDFLRQLGENEYLHIDPKQSSSIKVEGNSMDSVKIQCALEEFFGCTWWTRVWTVQEWVLAQQSVFQCGNYVLDGDTVKRGVRSYFQHQHECCHKFDDPAQKNLFRSLIVMESLEYVRLFLGRISFPYILSQFRLRKAKHTHDKVYGMLGLATGEYDCLVEPDYKRCAEGLFEHSALTMIEKTKRLEVLSHICPFGAHNLTLPSFVPDWTTPSEDNETYSRWLNWLGHLHLYNSCGGEPVDFQRVTPGRISIKGIVLDEIEATGSAFDFCSESYDSLLEEMYDLAKVDSNPEELYCNSTISRIEAFRITMCGSVEPFTDTDRNNRPFFRRITVPINISQFKKWQEWVPKRLEAHLDDDIRAIQRPFTILTKGRKFVATKGGYIGFCPTQCQKGDFITVLTGGSVPFVLRRNQAGTDTQNSGSEEGYKFIGDSYIHGIMDGEALRPNNNAVNGLEYLVLC